jgi:hypothetical protein
MQQGLNRMQTAWTLGLKRPRKSDPNGVHDPLALCGRRDRLGQL